MTPATRATGSWAVDVPAVRKAIRYIKRRGSVTPDELVAWDAQNGKRLFDWNDPSAAEEWRRQQARLFLNSFRAQFEGMRVRAFIHVNENEAQQIEHSSYYTVEAIAAHDGMRAQVIADITGRMARLASELAMWRLTEAERNELFERLANMMNGHRERKTA